MIIKIRVELAYKFTRALKPRSDFTVRALTKFQNKSLMIEGIKEFYD